MRYRKILLPIDLNDTASWADALPSAMDIARSAGGGATVSLITVVPDFGLSIVGSFFPDDFEPKALAEAQARLHAFADAHVDPTLLGDLRIGHGSVYKEIIDTATALDADLIVMAAHRPDLEDFLLGPNAARVVRHSRCSVLVVRRPAPGR